MKKWQPAFAGYFAGRPVAIIADNDFAGFGHAKHISESLAEVASSVKVIKLDGLPQKGDVSDYLDVHTAADLLAVIQATPPIGEAQAVESTDSAEFDEVTPAPPVTEAEQLYKVVGGKIVWMKPAQGGGIAETQITNFAAAITGDFILDDGLEQTHKFEISATLGNRHQKAILSPSQFLSMNWPLELLGSSATISAGMGSRDRAREAIQQFSHNTAEHYVYVHLGWREIDGKWVYLYAGGAIGADGGPPAVETELPEALALFELPDPPTGDELRTAICASIHLLEVGPDAIMFPLIAAVYRGALGNTNFSIHLSGVTGSGKTELAALIQRHFGRGMDAQHLPASWASTPNSLEAVAFAAKDAALVVDDFAPTGSSYEVAKIHSNADKLMRGQGNRSGRQRLRSDTSIRPAHPPRGLLLSTGEDSPRGQSLRARLLILDLGRDDVDFGVLTDAQANAADGHYAASLAGFLQWIAGRYGSVQESLSSTIADLRRMGAEAGSHRRTPEITATLDAGLELFLEFAQEAGALTATERGGLSERAAAAFEQIAVTQVQHQITADPVRQYLEMVKTAFESGEGHVTNLGGEEPANAGRWGWCRDDGRWRASGSRIGWLVDDELYLQPTSSYAIAKRLAEQTGSAISISKAQLVKRLNEANYLKTVDAKRGRLTVRIGPDRIEALHLGSLSSS